MDARFERVEAGLADVRREMHESRDDVDERFRESRAEMAAGFAEVKDLLSVSRRARRW